MKQTRLYLYILVLVLAAQVLVLPPPVLATYGDWSNVIPVVIDSDLIDETLTDFPVLINITASSGINTYDLTPVFDEVGDTYNNTAWYANDKATQLYFEVEAWDSTAETAQVWVKIPTVSNATDTVIYFCYESGQDGSAYNSPADVWDSSYVGVWHLNNNSTTVLDSTSNDNDGTLSNSWLSGWDQRFKLTLDSDDVDADLTDFPVLLNFTADSGINGADLTSIFDELGDQNLKMAVTSSNEQTELYAEVEYWNSTSETAAVWVKVPTISNASDTTLYVYYDADHANNTSYIGTTGSATAANVWDSSYVMVQHMADNSTSTILDSTLVNNGTKTSANNPNEILGKIGNAQEYDGSAQVITIANDVSIDVWAGNWTIEFWASRESDGGFLGYHETGAGSGYVRVQASTSGYIECYLWDGSGVKYYALAVTENMQKIVLTHLNTTSTLQWTLDGIPKTATTHTLTLANINPLGSFYIGRQDFSAAYYNGTIDEFRISNVTRSAAWNSANYETETDDFISYTPESLYDTFLSAEGQINGAVYLDGNNDKITLVDDDELDLTTGMTLEAWLKNNYSATPNWSRFIDKTNAYIMQEDSSNNIGFGVYLAGGVGWQDSQRVPGSNNTITYWVGTYNTSTRQFNNYKNMVVYAKTLSGLSNYTIAVNSNVLGFGTYANLYPQTMIDEVRISNVSRSASWLNTTYLTQTDALLTFGDTTAPTYTGLSVSSPYINTTTTFSAYFADNMALYYGGAYTFGTNITGSWAWTDSANFTEVSAENITTGSYTVGHTSGVIVGYSWNFTDHQGNAATTGIQTFNIQYVPGGAASPGFTNPLFAYILQGDYLYFVIACYTSVLGSSFFGIIAFFISAIIYLRTKSLFLVGLMYMLIGPTYIVLFWELSFIAVIFTIIGLASIFVELLLVWRNRA